MRFTIINIGRVRQGFVREGVAEYLKRFPRDIQVSLEDLGLPSGDESRTPKLQADEAQQLLKRVPARTKLFLLDEKGKSVSSLEFAQLIQSMWQTGSNEIVFAIGGANGWGDIVRARSHQLLSLSPLTYPHQLTRLILVEQLYRAVSIIKGGPYHRE